MQDIMHVHVILGKVWTNSNREKVDTSNFRNLTAANSVVSINQENGEPSILRQSSAANSVVSDAIWPKFELTQDFMHGLVHVTGFDQKQRSKSGGNTIFPNISL